MSDRIIKKRPDLRLIISSATIDAEAFLEYFSSSSSTLYSNAQSEPSKPKRRKWDLTAEDAKGKGKDDGDGAGIGAGKAAILSLEGRTFPVEIAYLDEPTSDYVMRAADTVMGIHLSVSRYSPILLLMLIRHNLHWQQPPGDILVFLTGREEIDQCAAEIAERVSQ